MIGEFIMTIIIITGLVLAAVIVMGVLTYYFSRFQMKAWLKEIESYFKHINSNLKKENYEHEN